MTIEIRPFDAKNENVTPSGSASDSRVTEFMDAMRARNTTRDEAQTQTWAKQIKPAPKRKPIGPARPGWLNAVKPAQDAAKPSSLRNRPFGSPKKRTPKA